MIKSLSNITDLSILEQNEKDNILSFNKIDFDDTVMGSGGFATVYKVVSIDGIQKTDFVLKILNDDRFEKHNYDSIKLLHEKLKKIQLKTGTPIYHELPELVGLPFIVFKGYDEISEKQCVAFLMYNLVKFNYVDYGSDSGEFTGLTELNIKDKLYLAYQLAKTINFLHEIKFIHSDISENSIWINTKRQQLTIIDYDSGYHFDSQAKPTTIGKINHWIGRRFSNIIGRKKDPVDLTFIDRLEEESWVLANAIFEVIFGVMPFFFLYDTDDDTKLSYLKKFQWPFIEYRSPIFNTKNEKQHKAIISVIEQFNDAGANDLIDAFKLVFNKGYKNESKRLSAKQWKELLFHINQSQNNIPLINKFSSNKKEISCRNENVKFAFDVQKFNALYLNNILISLNQNQITIPIQDNCRVFLKAVNDFEIAEDFIEIEAIKSDPKIVMFNASTLLRDSLSPIELSWKVENAKKVSLSNVVGIFPLIHRIAVEPIAKTTYILCAHGFFDQVINKELIIDVITPTIKSFDWKINLDFGIDNVDLSWETENAISVIISPRVGDQPSNGIYHVGISGKTIFSLTAIGLFSQAKIDLEAVPFPIPLIEKLLVPEPIFESNMNINISISDIVTRTPIIPTLLVDDSLFVIQKLPDIEEPIFLPAEYEIIQKTKPRNFDKLISKLKYNRKYEIKN